VAQPWRQVEAISSAKVDAGTYDDKAVVRALPFDDVELEVGRLFPPGAE
jgi:hypothetical protein